MTSTGPKSYGEEHPVPGGPPAGLPLEVRLAERLEDLEAISEAWDQLLRRTEQPLPVNSFAWISSFFEHCLAPGERWMCLHAWHDDRLVGVLPLVECTCRSLGRELTVLKTPRDHETDRIEVLAERGFEPLVLDRFVDALDEYVPGWASLRFTRLPQTSPTMVSLPSVASKVRIVRDLNGYGKVFVTTGPFAARFEAMVKNRRSKIRRARRRLTELASPEDMVIDGRHCGDEMTGMFLDLEASGWKGVVASSIKSSPAKTGFYVSLARRLAERSMLMWRILRADGKPLAIQMDVILDNLVISQKGAYNEAYAQVSPGHLLVDSMLRWAHDETDIAEIDCLTDVRWLDCWLPERRPYFDVWLVPRRFPASAMEYWPRRMKYVMSQVPGVRQSARTVRRLLASGRGPAAPADDDEQ